MNEKCAGVCAAEVFSKADGGQAADVAKDEEGLQTMRNLGRNMAWLLQCIEAGKKAGIEIPTAEKGSSTNFIR